MKTLMLVVIISVTLSSSSFSQGDKVIAVETFSKTSVPEKITEQMITRPTQAVWVFTPTQINWVGGSENNILTVTTYKYDIDTKSYTFVCNDKNGTEWFIRYKTTKPKHVMVTASKYDFSFMCHD